MSLPIVFAVVGDAVASGFVHSLPRPGTNASGITLMIPEMSAKRIEILNETFPKLRRLGVLHNPGDSASTAQLSFQQQSVRTAAARRAGDRVNDATGYATPPAAEIRL